MLAMLKSRAQYTIMAEIEVQEHLFDADYYVSDERLLIPKMLGRTAGAFSGIIAYAGLERDVDFPVYFSSDREATNKSDKYAAATEFEADFSSWITTSAIANKFEGYLVGFPDILDESGNRQSCIHFWANNSDVTNTSFAFPLLSIKELYTYPILRQRLQIEMDELAFGDVKSRIELPLFRDTLTGEVEYKEADFDDIGDLIEKHLNRPKSIFRLSNKRHSAPKARDVVNVYGSLAERVL